MTSEHGPTAGEPHQPEPRRRAARFGGLPSPDDLERLRDCIQKRLDQIEDLARERERLASPLPQVEASEKERALLQRVATLEQENDRLRTQLVRREQEWRTGIEQLEE